MIASVAKATAPAIKPDSSRTALGGFVKDKALAQLLGEMLFRDTVEVMADLSIPPRLTPPAGRTREQVRDNSVVGQVARTVLEHRSLDRYLWLIRRAYADSMWKGGDRARIEAHFPLIWRTSIMLYE